MSAAAAAAAGGAGGAGGGGGGGGDAIASGASSASRQDTFPNRPRVAVVGAGIAGCAAAWALHRAHFNVHLLEAKETLGGNAKTHKWQKTPGDGLVSGLSVLAWPDKYFHTYNALLKELSIKTELVRIRLFLAEAGTNGANFYAHDRAGGELRREFASDLQRWSKLVTFVRGVNKLFALKWLKIFKFWSRRSSKGSDADTPSLYEMSLLNPLNALPLYWLARAFGISRKFWNVVFVGTHSSSFLSNHMDSVQAMIAPALEDMISLNSGGTMRSWSGDSREVFQKMTQDISVHLACPVQSVRRGSRSGMRTRIVAGGDYKGPALFDKVIFACDAHTALEVLEKPSMIERALLSRIEYVEQRDGGVFLDGKIHTDNRVLPARHREDILSNFSNYVEFDDRQIDHGGAWRYDNTFIVSSWCPPVKNFARKSGMPMLISYNVPEDERPISEVEGNVSNYRAHPVFSTRNLLLALLMPHMQGTQGTYYCGSYTTPGNGHDLSLLSGLIAAHEVGAGFAFADHPASMADFLRLKGLMTSCVLWPFIFKSVLGVAGLAWLIKRWRK